MFKEKVLKKTNLFILSIIITSITGCGSYFSGDNDSAPAADNNAYLLDLSVSEGTISPAFDREITAYTVDLANSISSIIITPSAEAESASITVNGESVTSGAEYGPVSLDVGANSIIIIVTAVDRVTTKTYTIMAGRGDIARWGTAIWGQSLWNP